MTAEITVDALGAEVTIEAPEYLADEVVARWQLAGARLGPGSGARARAALPPPDSGPHRGTHDGPYRVAGPYCGADDAGADPEDERVRAWLVDLTQAVTAAAIGQAAGRLLMLHAAAVADPTTGRAVAVVAPGNTGKTTCVCTLGPGRSYLTDETVGIDSSGRVVPYAKPLSVRRADGTGIKDEIDPRAVGLLAPISGAALSGILLLARDGASEPQIEQLGLLDAIMALAPDSSSLARLDRPLERLRSLIETVGVRRVHYREVESIRPLIDEVLAA